MLWLQRLILTRMSPEDDVLENIKKMNSLFERLSALVTPEKPLTVDDIFATALLISLSPDWIPAISHLFQQSEVSSKEVITAIEREATRRGSLVDGLVSASAVLPAKERCSFCDQPGHTLASCWQAQRVLNQAKEVCLRGQGDVSSSSLNPSSASFSSSSGQRGFPPSSSSRGRFRGAWRQRRGGNRDQAGTVQVVSLESSDDDVSSPKAASVKVINDSVSALTAGAIRRDWLIDSGCSRTMTPYLADIMGSSPSNLSVRLADNSIIHASMSGVVSLPRLSQAKLPSCWFLSSTSRCCR